MIINKILVFGTFDTKGIEFSYLATCLNREGIRTITVDLGTYPSTKIKPDYRIADMADSKITANVSKDVRRNLIINEALSLMVKIIKNETVHGVISMGGGQGTYMAVRIFGSLPIGFPKVLLSTIALLKDSAAQFQGLNDTVVMNSIVDIAGLNSVLKDSIKRAAGAITGMVKMTSVKESRPRKRAIGISCWGVTTPCVNEVRRLFEEDDYEVYVFHANGEGGNLLEKFVEQGYLDGVADVTLSEISMPMAGSYQAEVRTRLAGSGPRKIPRVVVPGGLDMILVHKEAAILEKNRKRYFHTPEVVFVRSNQAENKRFAEVIGRKLAQIADEAVLILPGRGLSMADCEGGPLYEPETDAVLFSKLKENIPADMEVIEMDCHINDPICAEKIFHVLKNKIRTARCEL